MTRWIDPRSEAPSIRRAAVLLARIRQDGAAGGEIALLESEMSQLWRSITAGDAGLAPQLDRIEAALEHIVLPRNPPGQGSIQELLLQNALVETQAFLARLRSPRAHASASGGRSAPAPPLQAPFRTSARP